MQPEAVPTPRPAGGASTIQWRLFAVAVIVIVPVILGVVSLRLGRDTNWDLRNYHLYNAYAFLTDRMDLDVAPAQLQTFYNPLLDLPFYWMTGYLSSRTVGFIMGLVHGLNLVLVFFIFMKVINPPLTWGKSLMGLGMLAISGMAPGFISELGNTMNDNLVSPFVLGPLLILLTPGQQGAVTRRGPRLPVVAIAGFILGLGVGLKPTTGALAIGMAIALPLLYVSWRVRWMALLVFGLAGAAGVLVSTGWWWWELWTRFGNPFFPYFNNIFHSPYIQPASYVDKHFLPQHLWEYFVWPVIFSLDSYRANPLKFSDIRFAVLYFAGLVFLITSLWRWRRGGMNRARPPGGRALFDSNLGTALLVFFLASFTLWMLQSSNYRYLIPLELLVPLCFLLLLERMLRPGPAFAVVAIAAALLTVITFKPFNWIRLDWSDPYFMIDSSRFKASEPALVVMLGGAPTAYVIPSFPPSYRFVRPEGNLFAKDRYEFSHLIESIVENHDGSIYVLYDTQDWRVDLDRSSERLNLSIDGRHCQPLQVNTRDALTVCKAQKEADGRHPQ